MHANIFIKKLNHLKDTKRTRVTFIIILFILQSLIINHKSIYAQTLPGPFIRVTPIINDLKLKPGKPTSFSLTIENLSQNPLGIQTQLSGFDEFGDTPVNEQKPSQLVQWTNLDNENIVIGEKEKKTIAVTITPPKGASQKGYYETIFLTPILHQEQPANSPLILSRIGILVLGTIGNLSVNDLANKVKIENLTPSKILVNSFPKVISFTVANDYFTHFDAKPFLTLTPVFGSQQTILLEDKHVLPGSKRIWQYQFPNHSSNIFYHVHLAVSVGGGKQIFANTWFIVLPYQQLLLLLTGVTLILLVIFKRNRLKKFTIILFRG